jgi:hypothetical protein
VSAEQYFLLPSSEVHEIVCAFAAAPIDTTANIKNKRIPKVRIGHSPIPQNRINTATLLQFPQLSKAKSTALSEAQASARVAILS